MSRLCCLAAPFVILLCMGCNSSGAGIRSTRPAPDAGSPDLLVVTAAESQPDAWTAPDLISVPDTSPARLPDAWQAPSIDLGTDTLGGALAVTPDLRPALPKCSGPDDDRCVYVALGVQGCTLAAFMNMPTLDGGGVPDGAIKLVLGQDAGTSYYYQIPFRDACPALCGLCTTGSGSEGGQ